MKTVAARIDLGMTRIAGYILYDPQTQEFNEVTPKEVERLVKQGQVNGLVFNDNGELVPDLEGWNLGNIKIKSGVGNYRNWNTQDSRSDTVFSVVRAADVKDVGRIYEVINNRCGRIFFTKKHLVALSTMAWIGGIRVNDEDDTIELCKGVQVDDWSTKKTFELGGKVMNKDQLAEQTMEELFAQAGEEAGEEAREEASEYSELVEVQSNQEHEQEEASEIQAIQEPEQEFISEGTEAQVNTEDNGLNTGSYNTEMHTDGTEPLPFEPNSTWETPAADGEQPAEETGSAEGTEETEPEKENKRRSHKKKH